MADVQSLYPHCFGCAEENPDGLRLRLHRDDETVWTEFQPRRGHEGPPGFLHGGAAAGALDETMAWAAYVNEDEAWVTATLELRFRQPVPLDGGPYRIETELKKEAGRRKRVAGRFLLHDGTVAVEAEAVFVKLA